MKWVLVVLVLNAPLKTDLAFPSLQACMAAEGRMRVEWLAYIEDLQQRGATGDELATLRRRMPWGTCVPTK